MKRPQIKQRRLRRHRWSVVSCEAADDEWLLIYVSFSFLTTDFFAFSDSIILVICASPVLHRPLLVILLYYYVMVKNIRDFCYLVAHINVLLCRATALNLSFKCCITTLTSDIILIVFLVNTLLNQQNWDQNQNLTCRGQDKKAEKMYLHYIP